MARRETGVPDGWQRWYRETKGRLTPEKLAAEATKHQRAQRLDDELDRLSPRASEKHRRALDDAERLVRESNRRLRASGTWTDTDKLIKKGRGR